MPLAGEELEMAVRDGAGEITSHGWWGVTVVFAMPELHMDADLFGMEIPGRDHQACIVLGAAAALARRGVGAPLGGPADMAGIALFLASRAGSYINGAVLSVDGGLVTGT